MTEETEIINRPKYVGYLVFADDWRIALTKKPNPLHRFFSWLLLGWKWVDCEETMMDGNK